MVCYKKPKKRIANQQSMIKYAIKFGVTKAAIRYEDTNLLFPDYTSF